MNGLLLGLSSSLPPFPQISVHPTPLFHTSQPIVGLYIPTRRVKLFGVCRNWDKFRAIPLENEQLVSWLAELPAPFSTNFIAPHPPLSYIPTNRWIVYSYVQGQVVRGVLEGVLIFRISKFWRANISISQFVYATIPPTPERFFNGIVLRVFLTLPSFTIGFCNILWF